MATGRFSVEPLTDHIGAIIGYPDLKTLDNDDARILSQLLAEHLVLFFRDQQLDPSSLMDLASKLGRPVPYPFVNGLPDYPEVIEVIKRPEDATNFGGVWHSDTAYLEQPATSALLYGVHIPGSGGDTLFTNMYKVLESLSPGLQNMLGELDAHNSSDKDAIAETRPGQPKRGLEAIHPVIRTHPVTQKPLLFVDRAHTTRFTNMSVAESEPLLGYLFDVIERPEFSCRFSWQPGSVAFWDNRCCQHYPLNDYPGQSRRMLRVSLGEQFNES